MQDKAAIIAIGSELLAGQITNRNAAWLSAQLLDLGIEVITHLVVDDCEAEIVEAARSLLGKVRYLFVTGGLGPTSDDVTRQSIAELANRELYFDTNSWVHIQEIFQRLQLKIPESNRQQCYFPVGAEILANRAGTANAFALTLDQTELYVLPGPPREIEAIWQDHLKSKIGAAVLEDQRIVVRKWRTIGCGESAVAELVEPLVSNQAVVVSYRAHAPYVETKIRFKAEESAQIGGLLRKINETLNPWIFEQDEEDVILDLSKQFSRFQSINIYDGATQGYLLELLAPILRENSALSSNLSIATSWESHDSPALFVRNCLAVNDDVELGLAIAGFDEQLGWAVGVRWRHGLTVLEKTSPYRGKALRARNLSAIASLAAREFLNLILDPKSTH